MATAIQSSLLLCAAVFVAIGCDRRSDTIVATARTAKPTSAPAATGSISGQIQFFGKAIPPNVISVTDPGCKCQEVIEPGEKIAHDGGLADAIVYLDMTAVGDGAQQPTATLDQIHCNYEPHVLAVQTHQAVIIKSSDTTMHNVRYQSARNSSRNLTMADAGETFPTQFSEPEFIHFQCDVHPWMSAWVGVFDHPYFAVADASGQFKIEHVPAGTYSMVIWHELLGSRTISVKVGDGQQVQQSFAYEMKPQAN